MPRDLSFLFEDEDYIYIPNHIPNRRYVQKWNTWLLCRNPTLLNGIKKFQISVGMHSLDLDCISREISWYIRLLPTGLTTGYSPLVKDTLVIGDDYER